MRRAEDSGYVGEIEVRDSPGPNVEQALAEWKQKHPHHAPKRSAGAITVESDAPVQALEAGGGVQP